MKMFTNAREAVKQYNSDFGTNRTHYSRQLSAQDSFILLEMALEEASQYVGVTYTAIGLSWRAGFMAGYVAGTNDAKKKSRAHRNTKKQAG